MPSRPSSPNKDAKALNGAVTMLAKTFLKACQTKCPTLNSGESTLPLIGMLISIMPSESSKTAMAKLIGSFIPLKSGTSSPNLILRITKRFLPSS